MPNLTIGKKNLKLTSKLPQSTATVIMAKKRKQSNDENVYIGTEEEPASKSKRIKITQVKKANGNGRSKKSTRTKDWPNLNEVNTSMLEYSEFSETVI